ncbi:uncharacterized protein LOC119072794 isoform X1 [Bradysia coprophila]|uniref:uncharacterized protein LOC119072794 isoform X1 n=1 Tax=Bradysia coprophila TaxID=38358 RepID=UPI00187D7532|nr:uncharacterized protein LOC119072794 isoform X1 [Bradysia coprophila]
MNTKFIFLLIFAVFPNCTNIICSYAINAEPKVNEQEFGKEKRSLEDYQWSDDYLVTNIKKDLNDDDYRNGNAEPDIDDHETEDVKNMKKRETEVITDIRSFTDADIEQALSKLSEGELEVLEKVVDNEASTSTIKKRGIAYSDSDKICDPRYGCNSKHSEDLGEHSYKQIITYEQQPGERHRSSKLFKRFSRFSPLTREEVMNARIDFLKDNYKRQSEIGKIENSLKRRERYQRETARDAVRNPYFNSLIGPRSRTKRSVDAKSPAVNPMDDPQSIEHIKLLEESFPNPSPDNSLHSDQVHIRVKRA